MKHLLLLALAYLLGTTSQAQILKNTSNKMKQKAEQKANQKVDKTIDDATDGKKKPTDSTGNTEAIPASQTEPVTGQAPPKSLKAYSRYDFVPGDVILYAEDFSQDVIGEFPVKWNTNGSGEVVTLEGIPGKWLQLVEGTSYESPYKTKLPENFTVEYDLITEFKDDQRVPNVNILLYREPEQNKRTGAWLVLYPNGGTTGAGDAADFYNQNNLGNPDLQAKTQYFSGFSESNHKVQPVHVAIWVQKERLRAWVNQEKVYDLPKGMPADAYPERLAFELGSYGGPKENYSYYLSNIKIAAASPDTRSKLITEGKWSTSGILFDVNSDKIKPTSYGVLKEIAGVLTQNSTVKVKIIGHTDSDGEEAVNLDLSKRRAEAVKAALSSEFGIDGARMQADGMGESKPVADNSKPEGKAQNRRVEFVKQ